MLGKRLIKTSAGAACTTDTVQILDGVPFQSIATYELDGDATNLVETGYINKAGVFNGSSSRINLPSNPINGLSSVSFSFWIKPNDIASYQYVLSFINSVDGWNGVGIRITNTGKIQVVRANSGAVTTTENSTTTLSLNVWQHVAVSVQQSGTVIYINGSPDGTFSNTPFTTNNTGSFDIGMNEYASGVTQAFTNGSIDQVRIFNRVITANEVTTLYGETSASSTKSTTDIFADSSALALYEFEGNANDTGGTYNGTATNVVYNEYDGTASNVTYSTGKFGQAAVFNGSSSYIDLGNNSSNNNSTFSVSLWFNTSGHSSTATLINNGGANSQETGYFLGLLSSGYLRFNSTGVGSIDGSVNYADGNWHNVVMTLNNGAYNIYVDGNTTPVISGTGAFTTTATRPTWIGKFSHSTANIEYWDGKIDQVRIYDKAISAADVTTLYNETVATASTNITLEVPSLVAYYKMNDATDETGSYDGTPTNVNFNVAGKFGNAGEFNGSSSKIDYSSSIIPSTGGFSISWWMKWNGDSDYAFLFDTAGGGATNGFYCIVHDAADTVYWNFKNGSYGTNISVSYPVAERTEWTHFVITWDGTTSPNAAKIYKNKVATSGTQTVTQTASGQNFKLGYTGAEYFNGSIDQIRIFDRAITADEVTKLYEEVECIPTIVPTDHFNPVLYTGDGTSSRSITGVGFAPDFTWTKKRGPSTANHLLQNTVQGAGTGSALYSASTGTAGSIDQYGYISAFNTDGVTYQAGSSGSYPSDLNNENNSTYVAWNWKAGGAAVSNTDGTITSQVSANTDAGFSIVSYTGNSASSATIGHGLSLAPELIITKARNFGAGWPTMAKTSSGYIYGLRLNESGANDAANGPGFYNNTAPTASVYSVGGSDETNDGYNYVSYCFHSVDGYQRIGSWVGNGSANGPFVHTGFEPAWILIKNISTTKNWYIQDNKRATSNPRNKELYPDSSTAEYTMTAIDFYTNGFKIVTSDSGYNTNGHTYIFMAIAANPDTTAPTKANSFNTLLYTGNDSNDRSITGLGFKPDFLWIKRRVSGSESHALYDSVRGPNLQLSSDAAGAEATNSGSYLGMSSFDSDGFNVGNNGGTNRAPHTYVAWAWKGLDHDRNLPSINSNGSIKSLVSVNDAAGFSIVKYTGNETASQTVGHGLSSSPQIAFIKQLDGGRDWVVALFTESSGDYMHLNSSQAEATDTNKWSAVSSTTFTVGNDPYTNSAGSPMIAYCWYSVTGHSSIGSYSGNGSATGTVVTTGFEPRFVLIKRTSGANSWAIHDSKRSLTNPRDKELFANLSDAEGTFAALDFLSNGFQLKTSNSLYNASGNNYIYMAFK